VARPRQRDPLPFHHVQPFPVQRVQLQHARSQGLVSSYSFRSRADRLFTELCTGIVKFHMMGIMGSWEVCPPTEPIALTCRPSAAGGRDQPAPRTVIWYTASTALCRYRTPTSRRQPSPSAFEVTVIAHPHGDCRKHTLTLCAPSSLYDACFTAGSPIHQGHESRTLRGGLEDAGPSRRFARLISPAAMFLLQD
jgi:hypothetical protein